MIKTTIYFFISGFLLFSSGACAQQQPSGNAAAASAAKTVNKCISIEYAYENVGIDDVLGQQMFAKKCYTFYADADYLVIKSFAKNPAPNTMDAVVTTLIKDMKTGKVYSCFDIGANKVRTVAESNDQVVNQIFGAYTDPEFTFTKTDGPATTIQGFSCQKWHLAKEDMLSPFLFVASDIQPNDAIKGQPMFVQRDGKYMGLYLGNDTEFGPNTYHLRAQKVEIDQPQAIADLLNAYKDTDKKEVNKLIKAMMGM